jgi:lysozyme family protein
MYIRKAPSWKAATHHVSTTTPTASPAPAPATDQTAPPRFLACLRDTLIQECPLPSHWSSPSNFSDDPHDPGGATMCGIIQTEYDKYRVSEGLPIQSVELITRAEGDAIYRMNYWEPFCPRLQNGLDLSFFDTSVNMGPEEATRILQVALGIADDGVWGPQTSGAAAGITNVVQVIHAFTVRRLAVYETFSTFKYFGTDWARRTSRIGSQSVAMASPS